MCLGNSLKDFAANSMKKAELNGHVFDFSFDYYVIDNSKIINIYKNLMRKTRYKIMFGFINSIFMTLLTSTVNVSKYKESLSLSNQKCKPANAKNLEMQIKNAFNLILLIYILINTLKD